MPPVNACQRRTITSQYLGSSSSTRAWRPVFSHAMSGIDLPILQLAVDSGFATTEVYQWARSQGGRVPVIKGDSRAPALLGAASPVDVGPLGARIKRGIRVWPVNSGMAKEELYRWLRLERPTDEDLEKGVPFPIATFRNTATSTSSRSPPSNSSRSW